MAIDDPIVVCRPSSIRSKNLSSAKIKQRDEALRDIVVPSRTPSSSYRLGVGESNSINPTGLDTLEFSDCNSDISVDKVSTRSAAKPRRTSSGSGCASSNFIRRETLAEPDALDNLIQTPRRAASVLI